jgi:hypothetical protein
MNRWLDLLHTFTALHYISQIISHVVWLKLPTSDVPQFQHSRPCRVAIISRQTHTLITGSSWYLLQLLAHALNCGQSANVQFQLSTEVDVMLQLTVSQSVCQGIEPPLRLVTRYYFLSEICFLKVAVLSLWGSLSNERSGLSFVILSL